MRNYVFFGVLAKKSSTFDVIASWAQMMEQTFLVKTTALAPKRRWWSWTFLPSGSNSLNMSAHPLGNQRTLLFSPG